MGSPGLGGLADGELQGRFVLGLRKTSDSLELKAMMLGGKTQPAVGAVTGLANTIPNAWAVIDLAGLDRSIDTLWGSLSAYPGASDLVAQAKAETGLDLPADLKSLLGHELTASVGGDLTKSPTIVLAAQTTDGSKAQAILDRLLAATGLDGMVARRLDGNTLIAGSSRAAIDSIGTGGIISNPLFQQAVADPDRAQAVFFVDLGKGLGFVAATNRVGRRGAAKPGGGGHELVNSRRQYGTGVAGAVSLGRVTGRMGEPPRGVGG